MRPQTDTFDDSCFVTQTGRGPFHFVLLPGLVPDGRETFHRQQSLFKSYGDTTTVTWPYDAFDLEHVLEGIQQRIHAIASTGARPVLVGVSVGGGIALEILRRNSTKPLPLAAVLLVSPMTCPDDLAPLLKRFVEPIFNPPEGITSEEALEKGRTFFRTLASKAIGEPLMSPWKSFFTPQGWVQLQENAIRQRIEKTLSGIPTGGGLERVQAIQKLPGIHQHRGHLSAMPTLITWGSRERPTLRMDGPGTGLLCRPDLAYRLFPDAEIHWIYEKNGGEVPHASLLKHAKSFNPVIKRFLKRVAAKGSKVAAVG